MSTQMEVDTPKTTDREEASIAIHPLAIVHMSDQYTRISCGGSPLDSDAPVVGLLFGGKDKEQVLQIQDADDINTDTSEASSLQVELHRAVFPQHSVVGWYRVALNDEDPNASDLQTTKLLRQHYAPSSLFCFCLLQVQKQKKEKSLDTMSKDLPINIYEIHEVDSRSVLLGLSDWKLETSEPERIAVEKVMKERPLAAEGSKAHNSYVSNSKSIQTSLQSMKERVALLISFLRMSQEGKIPINHNLLRQVQTLLHCLGPLGESVEKVGSGNTYDADLLSHLAAVAKTVSAVQSYTDKFRLVYENKSMHKEMRRAF